MKHKHTAAENYVTKRMATLPRLFGAHIRVIRLPSQGFRPYSVVCTPSKFILLLVPTGFQ